MPNNWTREELIIAFNLYCKIPFSKSVKSNPDVIRVAELVRRSPSAVAFKLGNFGSLDPELKARGIGGLPNISNLDREIWEEFTSNWDELAFQSELLIASREKKSFEEIVDFDDSNFPLGKDREQIVKTRVNQNFFRTSILSSYHQTCCITGMKIPDLLIASHIVPWSVDENNRTNPRNGLCLNALHDKAFDRGFITITTDYKVAISKHMEKYRFEREINEFFYKYEGRNITLPDKFLPDIEFLDYHQQVVFKK